MICESSYYLIIILLFYNLVITALLNSDRNTKTYPSHIKNDNSIMCGNFELKIFCFHWSGKEFRMMCFFSSASRKAAELF